MYSKGILEIDETYQCSNSLNESKEFTSPLLMARANMLTLSLYQYQYLIPISTTSSNLRKDPITKKSS